MHRCTRCRWAYAPVRSLTRGHCCAGAASCANWCSGAARASSLQRGHPAWRLAVRSAQEKQIKQHCDNGPALLAIGWSHLQVCQNLLATLCSDLIDPNVQSCKAFKFQCKSMLHRFQSQRTSQLSPCVLNVCWFKTHVQFECPTRGTLSVCLFGSMLLSLDI